MRPQPRMQNKKAYEHSHHGHTGDTRHSPRNGFNGFLRALPGDRACLPPSSADCSANLMPASGHQNHTTSPSALARFVKHASASTASRSASVTIAIRPFGERDGRVYKTDLGQPRTEIFSAEALDWRNLTSDLICPAGNEQTRACTHKKELPAFGAKADVRWSPRNFP